MVMIDFIIFNFVDFVYFFVGWFVLLFACGIAGLCFVCVSLLGCRLRFWLFIVACFVCFRGLISDCVLILLLVLFSCLLVFCLLRWFGVVL